MDRIGLAFSLMLKYDADSKLIDIEAADLRPDAWVDILTASSRIASANEPASQPTRQSAARLKMAAASQPSIGSQPASHMSSQAGRQPIPPQPGSGRPPSASCACCCSAN